MMLLMTSPRALSKRPFMNEGGLLGATIVQKNISVIVIQHSHDVTPVDAPVVCGDLTPRARISRPVGGRSIREADPVCANGLARLSVSRRRRRRKDTRYLSSVDGQRALLVPKVPHVKSSFRPPRTLSLARALERLTRRPTHDGADEAHGRPRGPDR